MGAGTSTARGDLALSATMQRAGAALGFALVMALLPVDAAALRPLATQHITPFRATRACARMGWAEAKKKREEEDRIRFEQMEVPASRLPPPPPPSPPATLPSAAATTLTIATFPAPPPL